MRRLPKPSAVPASLCRSSPSSTSSTSRQASVVAAGKQAAVEPLRWHKGAAPSVVAYRALSDSVFPEGSTQARAQHVAPRASDSAGQCALPFAAEALLARGAGVGDSASWADAASAAGAATGAGTTITGAPARDAPPESAAAPAGHGAASGVAAASTGGDETVAGGELSLDRALLGSACPPSCRSRLQQGRQSSWRHPLEAPTSALEPPASPQPPSPPCPVPS